MSHWAKLEECSRSKKNGGFHVFAPSPTNHENPHFVASRALIKNRLGESSNLAHRGMHAKFQLIWTVRLVRAMGVVKIESSSYNWRKPVERQPDIYIHRDLLTR